MSARHSWHLIRVAGEKLERCGICGAERRTSLRGERSLRPHGTAPWGTAMPFCRPTAQVDLFDDYAFDEDDDEYASLPEALPTPPRPPAPLLERKPIDARPRSGARSPYAARVRGATWGLATADPHAALGVKKRSWRPDDAPPLTGSSYEEFREKGYEVTLIFDEEECFEFGLLAEGVPLTADVRWADVTTETMALRRAMHQMTVVARELVSRGCRRGARAAMKNRTTGEVFIWKFDQGLWQRSSSL